CTVKLVFPFSEEKNRYPPCASTTFLESVSPIPAPSFRVVKNGKKSFFSISFSTPTPSDCEKTHNLSNKYSKKLVRKMRKLYFYTCNTSKEFPAISYK